MTFLMFYLKFFFFETRQIQMALIKEIVLPI